MKSLVIKHSEKCFPGCTVRCQSWHPLCLTTESCLHGKRCKVIKTTTNYPLLSFFQNHYEVTSFLWSQSAWVSLGLKCEVGCIGNCGLKLVPRWGGRGRKQWVSEPRGHILQVGGCWFWGGFQTLSSSDTQHSAQWGLVQGEGGGREWWEAESARLVDVYPNSLMAQGQHAPPTN